MKKGRLRAFWVGVLAISLQGCWVDSPTASLTITLPARTRALSAAPDAKSFDAYFVNVSGKGIPLDTRFQALGLSPTCSYPGRLTPLFTLGDTSQTFTLEVPAGTRRTVQLIGVNSAEVSSGDFAFDLILGAFAASKKTLYMAEIASKTVDLFADTSITLISEYNVSQGGKAPFFCDERFTKGAPAWDSFLTYSYAQYVLDPLAKSPTPMPSPQVTLPFDHYALTCESALPSGLVWDETTGVLSGTPISGGALQACEVVATVKATGVWASARWGLRVVGQTKAWFRKLEPSLPPGRADFTLWEQGGVLWVFGGGVIDTGGNYGKFNEFWKRSLDGAWSLLTGGRNEEFRLPSLPSSRRGMVSTRDTDGKVWLFGGNDSASSQDSGAPMRADLWSWSSSATPPWVSHVPGPGYSPRARTHSAMWSSDNKIWIFGGLAPGETQGTTVVLNDLFYWDKALAKFTCKVGCNPSITGANAGNAPTTNWPTGFVNGTPLPAGREGAATWKDFATGKRMLFGGLGKVIKSGTTAELGDVYYNDLWSWDGTSWAPVGGTVIANHVGDASLPAARAFSVVWQDSAGRVFIYGGQGPGDKGFADMWLWDGNVFRAVLDEINVGFGEKAATDFDPGIRSFATGWVDSVDNLWVYAGLEYTLKTTAGGGRVHNDLWRFVY